MGYTGYYPATQHAARGANPTSAAGPGRPAGPGVGGWGAADVLGRRRGRLSGTTLRARSVPLAPPCPRYPQNAASGPIGARFHLISYKLSENGVVSPKSVEKACVSPYFQNGVQKSPLNILRFPFSLAFSHKELLVPFLTRRHVYCQNDEVSPGCTHHVTRERVVNTPTGHVSKLTPVTSSSLTQRAATRRYSQ